MLGKRFYLFYVTETDMYNKSYRVTMLYLLYFTKTHVCTMWEHKHEVYISYSTDSLPIEDNDIKHKPISNISMITI